MLNIRRFRNRLIFNMGIPILAKTTFIQYWDRAQLVYNDNPSCRQASPTIHKANLKNSATYFTKCLQARNPNLMRNSYCSYLESNDPIMSQFCPCHNSCTVMTCKFATLLHLQNHNSMVWCKTAVTPLLTHWSYCSLALNHQIIAKKILKRFQLWAHQPFLK